MQVMTLECEDSIAKHLLTLLNALDGVRVSSATNNIAKKRQNASKHNFMEYAGLWKDRNIELKDLRANAWRKSF